MKYDVVVVGAGPAGATAAKFLAEKGIRTLLLDKCSFPRDKPCGGMVSIRTLRRFPYIPADLIATYSFGGSISSSSLKNQFQMQQEQPIAAFVVRKHFDHGLVRLALECGSSFMGGVTVTDIQRQKDNVRILLNNGESIESSLVIGADGVWSVIARKSGLGTHYPIIGRCLFQELQVENNLLDEYFTEKKHFQLYVKFMGVDGFGWVIPKNHCLNIGIGEIQPTPSQQGKKLSLFEVYHEYLHFLKKKKLIPPTFGGGKLQGGALPFRPLKKTFADQVLLCGDAAGLINPLTGDGIHYAMSSGMFAAQVCMLAFEASAFDASFLSKYQQLWKNDFGEEIRLFNWVLKRLLKKDRDEKYIRLLSGDPQIFTLMLTRADTQGKIQDYKWNLVKRIMRIYVKNFLRI